MILVHCGDANDEQQAKLILLVFVGLSSCALSECKNT